MARARIAWWSAGAAAAVIAISAAPAQATSTVPLFPDHPPIQFKHTAKQVTRIADRTQTVRKERARNPRLTPLARYDSEARSWLVDYFRGDDLHVEVSVDDRTGRVTGGWTGIQAKWLIARPFPGKFGHRLNAPYIWIPLCILFVAPFVDPRRPFRILHLDLLALLAFDVSHVFFTRGDILTAVPLVYPVLGYLFVRMLVVGFRPRVHPEPLVPFFTTTALVVAVVFLVGFRVTLNLADSGVTDVGYAGVIGADRIMRGDPLYDGRFPENNPRGDTYGPIGYLAYVPFTAGFGWTGKWDKLPAAHAAAIAFDLLALLGLFLLGRAVRAGPEGTRLGVALAFAWAAFPYTAFVLQSNTNDSLVAALMVLALLAARWSPARGAALAVASAAKLVPVVLVPLFATSAGDRSRLRGSLLYLAGFGGVLLLVVLPFLFQVGPDQVYDRTFGFQFERTSPFSVWGLHPSLDWIKRAIQVGTVVLALLVAFVPRRKGIVQMAAFGAALIIGLELGVHHWFYLYIVWFLPLLLVALFAQHAETMPARQFRTP